MAELDCSSQTQDVLDGLTAGLGTAHKQQDTMHITYGSKKYIIKHESSLISSNKIIILLLVMFN